MASLIEQVQSFLRAERSQQAFDESLRALSEGRQSLREHPVRSTTFDMHIQEASGGGPRGNGKMPHSISLAWDEQLYSGAGDKAARNWMNLTPRERKDVLLAIYLANPWVSACVDVIAKRITSGGLSIEPKVDKPSEENLHKLEDFCLRVNDDWDLLQWARACITDELIFGDSYSEIVFKGGLPFQIYKVDCLTMNYKANRYGQIEQYSQQLDSSREPQILDPKTIIRWWFPHPRSGVEPFSPIERVQDAVNIDKKMVNWMTTFFQKGAKFPYYVKGVADENEADRFMTWFKQNFTGEKNAHIPPVTWGSAEFVPLGNNGSLDMDFQQGRNMMRTEILSAYHVPPAIVGIIESGNIGGGTGEDQEKSFQYNTCDPIRHMFFEKFNYRIVQQGFNIHDYYVSTRYADYRTDDAIAKVQDERIRNGSMTINEVRGEMGKQPHAKGGDVPLFAVSKEVIPVERLDEMADEQREQMQQQIDAGDMNNEILKTKVDQAKNPPPPMPMQPGMQPPQPGQPQPQAQGKQQQPPAKQKQDKQESVNEQDSSDNQDDQQHRKELAAFILALFLMMEHRGSRNLSSLANAVAAYSFTTDEQDQFAHALAEAYLASKTTAYLAAMKTTGITGPGIADDVNSFIGWANKQVGSIVSTLSDQLGNFVSGINPATAISDVTQAIKGWIQRYTDYKVPQVVNVTTSTGTDAGTRAAIDDMLDALTSVDIDTSMVPDGLTADQIRLQVVPGHSSSDWCKEWAGRDFALDEADSIPFFPAHPGCIHSIEVYVVGGDTTV